MCASLCSRGGGCDAGQARRLALVRLGQRVWQPHLPCAPLQGLQGPGQVRWRSSIHAWLATPYTACLRGLNLSHQQRRVCAVCAWQLQLRRSSLVTDFVFAATPSSWTLCATAATAARPGGARRAGAGAPSATPSGPRSGCLRGRRVSGKSTWQQAVAALTVIGHIF